MSIIGLVDSYKCSHFRMYPKGLTQLYAYFECRKPSGFSNETVFFGFQYFLKMLEGCVLTQEEINQYDLIFKSHFGRGDLFNREGWQYILDNHDGRLPIKIYAVKEGSVLPTSTPLFAVTNTDPNCAWLVTYLETLFVQNWYPIAVSTLSYSIRRLLNYYADLHGCPREAVSFKLHDFGCRGVSSMESAAIGGAAHLLNFLGTDTIPALDFIYEYYSKDDGSLLDSDFYSQNIAGFSIPATEHSVMCSNGREGEYDICENLLNEFPDGFLAVVSDSYDIEKLVTDVWCGTLKDKILNRNGTLVIRPDSGDPIVVLQQLFNILGKYFGFAINEKGYKVLPSQVRLIWGDGINHESIGKILGMMTEQRWSIENIAFGMGGALLQKVNRDTFSCAYKVSCAVIDGKEIPIFKAPITDKGKISKTGRFFTEDQVVFENGKLLQEFTFKEIRDAVARTHTRIN